MTMNNQTEEMGARPMAKALLKSLAFYQRSISPAFARRCRYLPTCSEYAKIAIEQFGVGKGVVMAGRRLMRCRPFGSSGFDPVPTAERGAELC